MRSPSGDQAACTGLMNRPLAAPHDPSLKSNVPLAWNTWMRWLPESATAMREPSGDQAGDTGPLNRPSPYPNDPNPPTNVPSAR